MRNIAPGRITPIGTTGGITIGHWSDGPAHTLEIDFDWTAFPDATPAERARIERAAREWSRRIATEVVSPPIDAGTRIVPILGDGDPESQHEVVVPHDIEPDGFLVFMFDGGDDSRSFGGTRRGTESGVLTEHNGRIILARAHIANQRVISHEIGHVIGVGGFDSEYRNIPDGYVDRENHTFNGPAAMAENGGQPLPFQWIDANRNVHPPGTEGAEPDYSHLGVCHSIMAYCSRQDIDGPQAVDFAVLDDLGNDLLSAAEAAEPEVYGYGAWASYSAWGAGVERQIDHDTGADHTRAEADAFGVAPASAFADTVTGLTGSATWTGNFIGVDRSTPDLPPVLGRAALEIGLETLQGHARFDELMSVRDARATAFRHPALHYAITLEGNGFADAGDHVAGSLYGPQHQEMASVLDDNRAGIEILGAFGGIRNP